MRTRKLYSPHKFKNRASGKSSCIKMLGIYLCGLCKGMLIGMLLGKKLKK